MFPCLVQVQTVLIYSTCTDTINEVATENPRRFFCTLALELRHAAISQDAQFYAKMKRRRVEAAEKRPKLVEAEITITTTGARDFVIIPSLLSPDEVSRFEGFHAKTAAFKPSTHFKKDGDEKGEARRSEVAWLAPPGVLLEDGDLACPPWLFERLTNAARRGAAAWPEVLPGGVSGGACSFEHVQYSVYKEGGHYQQWHLDGKPPELRDGEDEDLRALAVVVLLRPAEKGGHLESYAGAGRRALRTKDVVPVVLGSGDALVFPAQRLWHRVTPVEQGTRSSLVFWTRTGPPQPAPPPPPPPQQLRVGKQQPKQKGAKQAGAKQTGSRTIAAKAAAAKGNNDDDEEDDEWREIERQFISGDMRNTCDDFDGSD